MYETEKGEGGREEGREGEIERGEKEREEKKRGERERERDDYNSGTVLEDYRRQEREREC
jgi:hypothetical protein